MSTRILVAGIGNIFHADDGFGVEVVQRLARRPLPDNVRVVDFGIRGMDLAYALLEDYEAVILVDAVPRGEPAGTLYLIEVPRDVGAQLSIDTHGMDPVKVLSFARALGAASTPTYVVGCEPAVLGSDDDEEVVVGLSDPVQAAVDEAAGMVESLIQKIGSEVAEAGRTTR